MEKLISMVEFVLEQHKLAQSSYYFRVKTSKYANFLKQFLTLGMFVPCDLEGNVLEEPKWVSPKGVKWEDFVKEYQEGKERVLFEGWQVKYLSISNKMYLKHSNGRVIHLDQNLTVESQTEFKDKFKLVLTPTAQKQIGL